MTRTLAALLAISLLSAAAVAEPAGPEPGAVRRFALVVGSNRGAAGRVPLRYAVADADRFADLLTHMGGVAAADRVVLHDPTRAALLEALAAAGARVGGAREGAARVEVIVYFSGHADEEGLMLGAEVLPYRELREAVGAIGADVGITILDACASGAITRLKGGRSHPAFLAAVPGTLQGYAFLTSSSENEAAQESERLGASFFTHALVTGLRGAADVTGDGRVTLNEAYQFAFHETLAQTTTTQSGAQHPSYDIKMAGSGDVVMTDVAQTSSGLVIGEDYDGRFFILNAQRQLVAELHKTYGRRVELGLEPGAYEVFFEQPRKRLTTTVKLAPAEKKELGHADLRETRLQPTRRRGPGEARADLLDGRVRAQAGWLGRYSVLHWGKPSVGYEVSFGTGSFFSGGTDVLLGARYYFPLHGRVRPYAGALLGRYDVVDGSYPGGYYDHGVFGGAFTAGVDVIAHRRFALDFATRTHLAGAGRWKFEVFVGLGFLFGGREKP